MHPNQQKCGGLGIDVVRRPQIREGIYTGNWPRRRTRSELRGRWLSRGPTLLGHGRTPFI